jgi:hypothetical protein
MVSHEIGRSGRSAGDLKKELLIRNAALKLTSRFLI